MASLVKRTNGSYGLIWTDREDRPDKPQTREALKTDVKRRARSRKRILEALYDYNEHDPWELKWYRNQRIKSIVLSEDLSMIESIPRLLNEITLGKAADEYIRFKTETPGEWDSPNTIKNYSRKIQQFVRHTGPGKDFGKVTDRDVTRFVNRGDLSDFTIQTDIRRINTFLEWGEQKGYRQEGSSVSGPSPQKDLPDFLYNDELKKVCRYKIDKEVEGVKYGGYLKESHCQWWIPLFWILLARTGMRPSEMIAVRLSHIKDGEILVRKGTRGKSQAAKRRVPIVGQETRQVIDVLTDRRIRAMDDCMKESDYLFGRNSDSSQKRASREFSEAVHVMLQREDFKLRDLRNCWAYWFITRDRSQDTTYLEYSLKRIMGHSTDKMSQHYMDSLPYNPDLQRLHQW